MGTIYSNMYTDDEINNVADAIARIPHLSLNDEKDSSEIQSTNNNQELSSIIHGHENKEESSVSSASILSSINDTKEQTETKLSPISSTGNPSTLKICTGCNQLIASSAHGEFNFCIKCESENKLNLEFFKTKEAAEYLKKAQNKINQLTSSQLPPPDVYLVTTNSQILGYTSSIDDAKQWVNQLIEHHLIKYYVNRIVTTRKDEKDFIRRDMDDVCTPAGPATRVQVSAVYKTDSFLFFKHETTICRYIIWRVKHENYKTSNSVTVKGVYRVN